MIGTAALIGVLSLMVASTIAFAGPSCSVGVGVHGYTSSNGDSESGCGEAVADIQVHDDFGDPSIANFQAFAEAFSVPGSLGATAVARANGLVPAGTNIHATASASASLTDTITLSGTGMVLVGIYAQSHFVSTYSSSPTDPLLPQATAGGLGGYASSETYDFGSYGSFTWTDCSGALGPNCGNGVVPGTYTYRGYTLIPASQQINVSMFLFAEAEAYLYNPIFGTMYGGSGEGRVDASHTLQTGIEVFTPGITFTSESGYDYSFRPEVVGVPEPITLSVFGIGAAGAIATRRRRNKSV